MAGGCAITAEVGCAPGAIVGAVVEGIFYVGSVAYVAYKAHEAMQSSGETKPNDKPKAPPLPSGLVGDQSGLSESVRRIGVEPLRRVAAGDP